MRKLFLSLCLLASASFLFAQKGKIVGTVVEASSGFTIIGGSVYLSDNPGVGTVTDLDGRYELAVEPGTYVIEMSYTGFQTLKFLDVIVEAGKSTNIDAAMEEESIELDLGVTVVAKKKRDNVVALLTIQKSSPVVLNGISAAQISQSGDNDAAAAVRRVTGVTVEGGKYVYVRGLGDRYSKTTLNGAEVPGLDPNRNTVQMDLFPTNLIDNILVYKSFSPDMPGDFTGGYVDIATKDFPSEKVFTVSASAGYNTNVTGNSDFLTYTGGDRDWLGFDDGTRAVPSLVENTSIPEWNPNIFTEQERGFVADATSEFANNWTFVNEAPPVNHNFGISFGNQKEIGGKPLGFIGALTYQRNFSGFEAGDYGIYDLPGKVSSSSGLNPQLVLEENRGMEETLWGAMFSSNLKVTPNHKIGLMLMHNQSSNQVSRYLEGVKAQDDEADIYQTRTWDWLERGLSTAQLNGKHVFTNANKLEMNWTSSYSLSTLDNPDVRFFTNRYRSQQDRSFIKPSSDPVPTRFFRDMSQYNLDNKINFSLPFNQWNGLASKLKVGFSHVFRDREFRESRYIFEDNQNLTVPNGIPTEYFADENLYQGVEGINTGVHIVDNYDARNNYDADQSVTSAYAMVELPLTAKLRAITGVRMEKTAVRLLTFDDGVTLSEYPQLDGDTKILDNTDLLPALSLNYEFNDAMKLRFGYSRTLARPNFRELAPFANFDVAGGFIFVGNPELERTLIDNFDLRWEFFSTETKGDMVSVSGFYKDFTNPIENTFNPIAANTELTWNNVDNASVIGGEVEFRKNLGTFAELLTPFTIGANFTYVVSETTIPEDEYQNILQNDPEAENTREMFGQAPYSANALLSFANKKGTKANVSFNVVGERITVVTRGATPDYYQQPMPLLNINVSQRIANGLTAKISANNLLNAEYQETAEFKGNEYFIRRYQIGRTFSLGLNYNLSN